MDPDADDPDVVLERSHEGHSILPDDPDDFQGGYIRRGVGVLDRMRVCLATTDGCSPALPLAGEYQDRVLAPPVHILLDLVTGFLAQGGIP